MNLHFPDVIDNSMRKELVKCQKIAHWKFEKGLNAPEEKEDLVAGKAFAKGIEVARRAFFWGGMEEVGALGVGIEALYKSYGDYKPPAPKKYKTSKTAERVAGALAFYVGAKPLDGAELKPFLMGGELTVEMTFAFEIPISHPITGRPLRYVGNFDMLAKDANGDVWVVDEKTTGQMTEAWVHQWLLDSQMTGYCWGARKLLASWGMDPMLVKGAIINGVAIRALSNENPYEHMAVPCFREDWQIERWYQQMLRDVEGWKDAYLKQNHNQVLDHACAIYNSPCQYAKLCNARNPEQLEGSYKVKFWNPLDRDA